MFRVVFHVLLLGLSIVAPSCRGDIFPATIARSPLRDCSDTAPPIRTLICARDVQFRYFYDAPNGRCRLFVWGGCDTSRNNFDSEKECRKMCNGVAPNEADRAYIFPIISNDIRTIGALRPTDTPKANPTTESDSQGSGLHNVFKKWGLRPDEITPTTVAVPKSSLPWVAQLMAYPLGMGEEPKNCTGSLIAPGWVITSAGCTKASAAHMKLASISVSLIGNVQRTVTNVFYHPSYSLNFASDYNVALLKLNALVPVTSYLYPIPLPDYCPGNGSSCQVLPREVYSETTLEVAQHAGINCSSYYMARLMATRQKKCNLMELPNLTLSTLSTSPPNACKSTRSKVTLEQGYCIDHTVDCNECDVGAPIMCRSAMDQFVLTGVLSPVSEITNNAGYCSYNERIMRSKIYIQRICKITPWIRQVIATVDYSDNLTKPQDKYVPLP